MSTEGPSTSRSDSVPLGAMLCCGGVVAISILALTGWATGLRELASFSAAYRPMSPDSAVAFVALTVVLYGQIRRLWTGRLRPIVLAIVAVISLYGFLKFLELPTQRDLTFANVLFPATETIAGFPAWRMSHLTGLVLLAAGISLALLLANRPHRWITEGYAACSALLWTGGFASAVGYGFGTPLFYGGTVIPVSVPTVVAQLLLGTALLIAGGNDNFISRRLAGPSIRARLNRTFLPVIAAAVLIQGLVQRVVSSQTGYNTGALAALLTLAFLALAGTLVTRSSRTIAVFLDRARAERERSDRALRDSEERFRRLFERAPLAYQCLDEDGGLVDVNQMWLQTLGYSPAQVLGRRFGELLAPGSKAQFDTNYAEFKTSGVVHGIEYEMVRPDGKRVLMSFDGKASRDKEGRFQQMHCILVDVTEQRRAEARIAHLNQVLRAIRDINNLIVRERDPRRLLAEACDILLATRNYCLVWVGQVEPNGTRVVPLARAGATADYLDQITIRIDAGPYGQGPVGSAIRTRQTVVCESVLTDPQFGPWRQAALSRGFASVAAIPMVQGEGVFGALGVYSGTPSAFDDEEIGLLIELAQDLMFAIQSIQDETERKRAEEKERKSAERYALLFEQMLDGFALHELITDDLGRPCDYRFLAVNPAFERMTGLKAADLIDKTVLQVLPETEPYWIERYGRVALTGEPASFTDYARALGKYYEVSAFCPQPGQFAVLVIDVTQRKRDQDQLQDRANEFAALYSIARDLARESNLAGLLPAVLDRAIALLNGAGGMVYVYDAARDQIQLAVARGGPVPVGTWRHMGDGVSGQVAQTRKPLVVEDFAHWESRSPLYDYASIASVIDVPMLFGGELIGVLGVHVNDTMRKFTERDVELLSLLAAQAAGAIHNARLLDETRGRAQQLGLLYDAGLALNRVLEPRDQLQYLLRVTMDALRGDRAGFFRHDEATRSLTFEIGLGAPEGVDVDPRLQRFAVGEEAGLVGWVAEHRVLLNLVDVTRDARWIPVDLAVRSAVWVPIEHEGRLHGVLMVSRARAEPFTEQDERLLTLFANQVSVAMENARLFGETRRRLAELEAIDQLTKALRSVNTLEQVLPMFLDSSLSVLGATVGNLYLVDQDSSGLQQAVVRGAFKMSGMGLSPDKGLAGRVIATGQAYVSREFRTDPNTRDEMRQVIPEGWGGILLPILVAQEVIGLTMIGVELPREINPDEVRLLTTLAEIAGNAFHRTRLYEQTEQRLSEVQALRAIDTAITASVDLRLTLNVLLEQVSGHLHTDAAGVLLLNAHTRMLDFAASTGFRSRVVERVHLRLGADYAGRIALDRRPVHISHATADSPLAFAADLSAEGFRAYHGVPLIAKGQVIGVLELFHRSPLVLRPHQLDFLNALATQAAIAIESAELFEGLQRSNLELGLAYDDTIEGWSRALDLRDKETEGHTRRVTEMTVRLARAMGIPNEELVDVQRGALLHDIGKMGIPDSILLKPGALTPEEWAVMQRHPVIALELLSPISYLRRALSIPYGHHEKWDGTGYPRRLKGDQIPMAARLFAIVDVWDALRSDRPYRAAWPDAQVNEYLAQQSGTHFDPRVVHAFLRLAR